MYVSSWWLSCLSSTCCEQQGTPIPLIRRRHALQLVRTNPTRNALVGEFMVAFLLVFIASRTAMNSDFFHSSMACFAIGAQEPHEERSGGRVHGRFLACLHCVTNSCKFRFLYSPMAWFAIGAQVITHFSQDRVQQRLHPQRERYTMSATRLCTLVSPPLPCRALRLPGSCPNQVLAQHVLFRYWKGTKAFKTGVYLFPCQLDEKVKSCTFLRTLQQIITVSRLS